MKVSSLAVTALTLLANSSDTLASSSSSSPPLSTGAAETASTATRRGTFLPRTNAKLYNPIGGDSVAVAESDGSVLLGQGEEASESLDISIPLSQASTLRANDAPLSRDIEMLTEILSDLVLHEDEKLHKLCQEFIGYGSQRCVQSCIFFSARVAAAFYFRMRMKLLKSSMFPDMLFLSAAPKIRTIILRFIP